MPSLLFEIGCEELPARACESAAAQLPDLVRTHVGPGEPQVLVGPRRIAFLLHDLVEREEDRVERRRGPSEQVAFDEQGEPTQAAQGFARSNGVAVTDLERADGFLWATQRIEGRPTVDVLPDALAALVRGLNFPKTMRWDASGLRFPRPIRWLCAKLDERDGPRVARRPDGERRLLRSSLHLAGSRDPKRRRVRGDAARRRGRARPGGAARRDPAGARGRRRVERSARRARRGRPSRRAPARPHRALRRAVPRAAAPRDRDGHAVAPALLPARARAASPSWRTAGIPS